MTNKKKFNLADIQVIDFTTSYLGTSMYPNAGEGPLVSIAQPDGNRDHYGNNIFADGTPNDN